MPAPHPRDVFDFVGGDAQETAFLESVDRSRLHHAWMLTGPEGVGKATFAYRAARRLLGAAPDKRYGLLGSDPGDPECRLVSARAHPDLMVLERQVEDGRLKNAIVVDDARALPVFFSKAPSRAAFRVAIVDAADDLNINAANALLKILEEPPARGVLFMVTHAPGRIMATLRSRCRRLAFAAWEKAAVETFVRARATDADPGDVAVAAAMANGAPGAALRLLDQDGPAIDALARALVERADGVDEGVLHAQVDGFRRGEGQANFELLLGRMAAAVHRALSEGGVGPVEPWAALWDKLTAAPAEADAVNLDRADVFWTLLGELRTLQARSV